MNIRCMNWIVCIQNQLRYFLGIPSLPPNFFTICVTNMFIHIMAMYVVIVCFTVRNILFLSNITQILSSMFCNLSPPFKRNTICEVGLKAKWGNSFVQFLYRDSKYLGQPLKRDLHWNYYLQNQYAKYLKLLFMHIFWPF